MANVPMKIPIWARGTLEQLEHAITVGVFKDLDRVLWCYITEGEKAGSLALVYTDKTIHFITDGALAEEVAELAVRVQANADNIEVIQGTLETVSETLTAYAEWAETVNASLSELRTDLDALDGRMGTAEDELEAHAARLDGIDTSLTALGNRVTAAEGRLDGIDASLDSLGGRMTAAEADITAQGETLETHAQQISDIEDILDDEEMGGQTVPEYVAEQMEDLKQEIEDAFDVEFI